MGDVGRVITERSFATWLSAGFCSSSSVMVPPSTAPDTEDWLLEREKREKKMPPMPFPMLAAPIEREYGRGDG